MEVVGEPLGVVSEKKGYGRLVGSLGVKALSASLSSAISDILDVRHIGLWLFTIIIKYKGKYLLCFITFLYVDRIYICSF